MNMLVRRILSKGAIVNFQRVAKMIFMRGPKVVKFDFTHSKLREQPYFAKNLMGKYKISKSRGTNPGPPCDTHDHEKKLTRAPP